METSARPRGHTFANGRGSTRAWGGDLCQLLSVEEDDKVPHLRRKASDAVACQMYHASRVVSRMRDTVILIHGPRGCAQTLSLYTKFFDGFRSPNFGGVLPVESKVFANRSCVYLTGCLKAER